uniref:LAGLIDADG homing endonuclease n=1 Tax=Globodera rostochiensis TaxID=31243 RepID=A0A914H0I1_GLORO
MNNLCCFYLAKMAVVFILMISSTTLEAQRNEKDKFFDLMTTIGEFFGGEFNDTEKALELDLNGTNSFLEELHSFATHKIRTLRAMKLEALVHGKNIDGTLKEKKENSKDKIQTFLAVPKCFVLQESELNIFDYWIKIIKMKTKNSQNPIYGVAIYKEKYGNLDKSERNKEEAFTLSRANYKILKQLNDQKFSIYESSNLLRLAFNWGLMKMISDKAIDPELHLESLDKEDREKAQKDVEENCKKFENEEAKIIFLNNVHYELAINFELNQRKDIYDRAEDLLSEWEIPLMQLKEKVRPLAKTFGKMLENVKEHYAKDESNVV